MITVRHHAPQGDALTLLQQCDDIRWVSERVKAVSGKAIYMATLSLKLVLLLATPRAVLRLPRPISPEQAT